MSQSLLDQARMNNFVSSKVVMHCFELTLILSFYETIFAGLVILSPSAPDTMDFDLIITCSLWLMARLFTNLKTKKLARIIELDVD